MFPIIIHNLIDVVGCAVIAKLGPGVGADPACAYRFQWTMRVVALILFCLLTVTFLTIERRLPPKPDPGPMVNVREFRSVPYTVYCLSGFVTFLGLYTVRTPRG